MKRTLMALLPTALLLTACTRGPRTKSANTPSANDRGAATSTDDRADMSSYAANAEKVTDACTLMPVELVKRIVPAANTPQGEQYPRRCSVSNGTSVLEITIRPE